MQGETNADWRIGEYMKNNILIINEDEKEASLTCIVAAISFVVLKSIILILVNESQNSCYHLID